MLKFNLPKIEQKPIPKGKRRVSRNIYGNWVGYVSNKRVVEFGTFEIEAKEWAKEEK